MGSYKQRTEKSWTLYAELGYDARGKRIRKTKTVRVEDTKLLKAPTKLKRHLEEELLKFETEIRNGEYVDPDKSSFSSFVEIWKERHAPKVLSPTTLDVFKRNLDNHILPYFGDKKISTINTVQITAFLDRKMKEKSKNDPTKTLSPSTVKYLHRILKHIFTVATEWKVIKDNPMVGVKAPTLERKEMQYFSGDEMPFVLEILYGQEPMWKIFFILATFAGLRRGENVALQWKHINLEESELTVEDNLVIGIRDDGTKGPVLKKPKSAASAATIPLPFFVTDLLKVYRKNWLKEKMLVGDHWEGGEKEYLYHDGFGNHLYPDTPSKKWRKIRQKHDMKDVRLHDLRHTMVALLMEEDNVNLLAVSKQARHTSSKFTADVYGHISKKRQQKTINQLQKYKPS